MKTGPGKFISSCCKAFHYSFTKALPVMQKGLKITSAGTGKRKVPALKTIEGRAPAYVFLSCFSCWCTHLLVMPLYSYPLSGITFQSFLSVTSHGFNSLTFS